MRTHTKVCINLNTVRIYLNTVRIFLNKKSAFFKTQSPHFGTGPGVIKNFSFEILEQKFSMTPTRTQSIT